MHRMRNIDLQLLRSFRATASTGNMTRAANLLNVSQGAVSQQIKKLEDQLGCKLLDRDKSGITLTRDGEKLFNRAQELLVLNDQIFKDMTEEEFSGRLNLGVPLDLVNSQLPITLRHFAENYPDVDINLICATSLELQQQFEEGALDITLREEVSRDENNHPIFQDQLVWITAKNAKAHLQDPLPLSIASTDCVFRHPTTTTLDLCGRRWKRVYESNNIDAVQAMIRMDLAVGVYLQSFVPATLNSFIEAEGFPKLPKFSITLAVAKGPNQNLADLLADYIRRGFQLKKAA